MSRAAELEQVKPEHHARWLALQIDELEAKLIEQLSSLAAALEHNSAIVEQNTKEHVQTRTEMIQQQSDTRNRFTWLALTVSLTIITAALTAFFGGVFG